MWTVRNQIRPAIPLVRAPVDYPALSVSFECDSQGSLVAIHQLVDLPSNASTESVVSASVQALGLLREVLEFRCGLPVQFVSQEAQDLSAVVSQTIGFAQVPGGAAIIGRVELPPESDLTSAGPRLAAQLHLCNAARQPMPDYVAVYLYYLVLEDMQGPPASRSAGQPSPQRRLKYTRDFVGHGVTLSYSPEAISFIQSETGQPIATFDPLDPDHTAFVRRERENARKFIESELARRL
jgi:hypothetical protein